ncbi:MAG: ABC transporter substrate-binding protein [Alphaproteobacteria bacterium]
MLAFAATTATITTHEVQPAETYVQNLADRLSGVLASSKPEADKEREIRTMIDGDLDGDAIAKYTLGALWKTATPEEFKEFVSLLKEYASTFYEGRLNEYGGAKVGVTGSVANGKKAVIVGSTISNLKDSDPVQIDWLVVRSGESFKLVDFRFQGIWIARSWGDQFASIVGNSGGKFAALNSHLKQQIAGGTTNGKGVSGAAH